jgi:hypothetical protein
MGVDGATGGPSLMAVSFSALTAFALHNGSWRLHDATRGDRNKTEDNMLYRNLIGATTPNIPA